MKVDIEVLQKFVNEQWEKWEELTFSIEDSDALYAAGALRMLLDTELFLRNLKEPLDNNDQI